MTTSGAHSRLFGSFVACLEGFLKSENPCPSTLDTCRKKKLLSVGLWRVLTDAAHAQAAHEHSCTCSRGISPWVGDSPPRPMGSPRLACAQAYIRAPVRARGTPRVAWRDSRDAGPRPSPRLKTAPPSRAGGVWSSPERVSATRPQAATPPRSLTAHGPVADAPAPPTSTHQST